VNGTCPRCDLPVVLSPGGALEAEPHPLGVLGPDGEPLPVRAVLAGRRAGVPVGRRRHFCPPGGQGELFAIPARTDKTRGGRR